MAGHATLLDAFQEFTGLARQGMEIWSGIKKENADLFLKNIQLRLYEERQRYLNDVKNGLVSNDKDDLNALWEQRSGQLYNGALKQARNGYTKEALDYMFNAANAQMRPELENAERERLIEQNLALMGDNVARRNAQGGDPAEKTKYADEELGRGYLTGQMRFPAYFEAVTGNYSAVMLGDAERFIDKAIFQDGKDLDWLLGEEGLEAWDRDVLSKQTLERWEAGETGNPAAWAEGAERPTEGFTRVAVDTAGLNAGVMDAAKQHAREQYNIHLKRIQGDNDKAAGEIYNQALNAWLVEKNPAKALELAKGGLAWLQKDMGGVNMAQPDYHSHTQDFSSLIRQISSGADKPMNSSDAQAFVETAIRAVLNGNREYNLLDLFDFGTLRIEASATGYDISDPDSVTNIQKALNGFWKTFEDVITKSDEYAQLRASYQRIKDLRTLNKGLSNLYKDPGDQTTLDSWLAMEALNMYGGLDFRNTNPMDIDARVDEMAGQVIAMAGRGGIKDFAVTAANTAPLWDVIRMLKTRNANGYFVETDVNGREIITPAPGDRALYKDKLALLDAQEEKIIAGYKSLDTKRLIPRYENEGPSLYGNNPHEKKASRIYQLDGGGTYYRLIPGEGKNFTVEEGKMQANGAILWGPTEGKYVSPDDASAAAFSVMAEATRSDEEAWNSLESRTRDFATRGTDNDDNETSARAQYEQGISESLAAEIQTKERLLKNIREEKNSRNREEMIQRGIRNNLLTHKEADELREELKNRNARPTAPGPGWNRTPWSFK
jgi:hypothetical protein